MQANQKGAAVVMALFIVVLCTLAVSPLIWTLYASAKTVSVDSARGQAQQVSLSGLDWARVILREDARVSTTDNLTEPWAVPLADSRLSEGLMRRGENASNLEDREALLSGLIEDAQARLNLRNLGGDVGNRLDWLESLTRLGELLGISQQQLDLLETVILEMYPAPNTANNSSDPANSPDPIAPSTPSQSATPQTTLLPALTWAELKGRYNIESNTWEQLQPHVVFLPRPSKVNANTASAEVMYSVLPGASFSMAQGVLNYRERVTFNNLNDLNAALTTAVTPNNDLIDVKSDFFMVRGQAQVREALIQTEALLERDQGRVYVLWRND